jgi:hypothetical protein
MPFGFCRAVLALIALLASSLAFGASAGAAPQCRQQVIEDWSDNGRIDRAYALRCYEQAMRSMPPEIRDYSDAPEVIDRALTLAVRNRGGVKQDALPAKRTVAASATAHTAETTAIPTSLFVLGALALSALAIGGAAYVAHRATSGRRGAAR